jgi:thioredoxin-disulfide reductase
MYDLIIIGGGPAGVTAGIYAARKKLHALVLAKDFWGEIAKTGEVENWPGELSISGMALAGKLEKHLKKFSLEIKNAKVTSAAKKSLGLADCFSLTIENGQQFETKALIIATGREPKTLNVEGERELIGKGVSYCSICDAPFFKDKAVAVVGGGNVGLEAALDLVPFAAEIFIIETGSSLRADEVLQDKAKAISKIKFLLNQKVEKINGQSMVEGLELEDIISGQAARLAVGGVFVQIGAKAITDFLGGLVQTNQRGEIKVDNTGQTSQQGIFAAGDVTDTLWKQAIIAAGQGATAALAAYEYLKRMKN